MLLAERKQDLIRKRKTLGNELAGLGLDIADEGLTANHHFDLGRITRALVDVTAELDHIELQEAKTLRSV